MNFQWRFNICCCFLYFCHTFSRIHRAKWCFHSAFPRTQNASIGKCFLFTFQSFVHSFSIYVFVGVVERRCFLIFQHPLTALLINLWGDIINKTAAPAASTSCHWNGINTLCMHESVRVYGCVCKFIVALKNSQKIPNGLSFLACFASHFFLLLGPYIKVLYIHW